MQRARVHDENLTDSNSAWRWLVHGNAQRGATARTQCLCVTR